MNGAFYFDPWATLIGVPDDHAHPANPAKAANSHNREAKNGAVLAANANGLAGLAGLAAYLPRTRTSTTNEALDLAPLVADTARRAHAAVSEPADAEDRAEAAAEREAMQGEADRPLPSAAEHERMAAGLLKVARGEPDDWPELATIGAGCYAATRANPDGSVETRHRLPDGSWGSPAYLPAPYAVGMAA